MVVGTKRKRATRRDVGRAHRSPEKDLQVACVRWAEANDFLVIGSPGGASFRNGGHAARIGRPGAPDILIIARGADGSTCLGVELKVGSHACSAAQIAWHARAQAAGVRVDVARSLAEFQAAVQRHLAIVID